MQPLKRVRNLEASSVNIAGMVNLSDKPSFRTINGGIWLSYGRIPTNARLRRDYWLSQNV